MAGEDGEDKCLYRGPDYAGNILEVVTVIRIDGTELVIHAMRLRRMYESLLQEMGEPNV